jgi:hypothetical protein
MPPQRVGLDRIMPSQGRIAPAHDDEPGVRIGGGASQATSDPFVQRGGIGLVEATRVRQDVHYRVRLRQRPAKLRVRPRGEDGNVVHGLGARGIVVEHDHAPAAGDYPLPYLPHGVGNIQYGWLEGQIFLCAYKGRRARKAASMYSPHRLPLTAATTLASAEPTSRFVGFSQEPCPFPLELSNRPANTRLTALSRGVACARTSRRLMPDCSSRADVCPARSAAPRRRGNGAGSHRTGRSVRR